MEEPYVPQTPQPQTPPPLPGADGQAHPTTSSPLDKVALEQKIVSVLQTVYDPEIPVNIYELGLIYGIDIEDDGSVLVKMTLTSPACPVAGSLPGEVEMKVRAVPQVHKAAVELVWDPPWNMTMMTDAARLQLNLF